MQPNQFPGLPPQQPSNLPPTPPLPQYQSNVNVNKVPVPLQNTDKPAGNVIALVGFILSLVPVPLLVLAIFLSLGSIPVLLIVSVWIPALVCSIIGLQRSKKIDGTGLTFAMIGIVISLPGIITVILLGATALHAINQVSNLLQ